MNKIIYFEYIMKSDLMEKVNRRKESSWNIKGQVK